MLGNGKKLFDKGAKPAAFKPVDNRVTTTGVVVACYRRAGDLERAAGIPLFLVQLLYRAEEIAEAGVPGSMQSLMQARTDRLDPAG